MTVRDGKMVYELNGLARDKFDPSAPETRGGDPRWDGFARPRAAAADRRRRREHAVKRAA